MSTPVRDCNRDHKACDVHSGNLLIARRHGRAWNMLPSYSYKPSNDNNSNSNNNCIFHPHCENGARHLHRLRSRSHSPTIIRRFATTNTSTSYYTYSAVNKT
mmetsp:Transcript_20313/g.56579  ORF Transcript_20313/g.56579 Transcript_20313/m.56579 type:complete len:102 (+) Transcript_20313:549-854(+)